MLWKGVSIGWNGFLSPLERWNHPSLVRGGQTTHQELDRVRTLARAQELGIHLDIAICTGTPFAASDLTTAQPPNETAPSPPYHNQYWGKGNR